MRPEWDDELSHRIEELDSGEATTNAWEGWRKMLDSRYDELKSGRVKAFDGESAFMELRQKSERHRRALKSRG